MRSALADYRANAVDVAQDMEDADVLIQAPTLALWGEEFYAVGKVFGMASVWKGMAQDVVTQAIPRADHLPHEEQPEIVNHLLVAFLKDWKG